jgi:undecaprenol kinase
MHSLKNQSFLARLKFAAAGILAGLRAEHSLRIHLTVMVAAILVGVWTRPEPIWWALLALSSAAVIAAELFNTAVEHLADHLHPEIHPAIRIVKDCAAGAVLVASLGALGVAAAFAAHLLGR